jgi:hypothetical protein
VVKIKQDDHKTRVILLVIGDFLADVEMCSSTSGGEGVNLSGLIIQRTRSCL